MNLRLREDWADAKAAALTLAREGDLDGALAALKDFHHALCAVRVLDPACGSGNFLYVTLEHLKRLEGEVLNTFDELDPERSSTKQRQQGLALEGGRADPFGGETVDPHQLLGIEVNPRAAAIAEMVLWIGYLQWHYRTRGNVNPPEPVLRDFRNIECRDAVLAWDRIEYVTDAQGKPITRWDGKTMKSSPVTGEPIPDDSARVPVERYVNPRKAEWPAAEFVVGNPPYLGARTVRAAIGPDYLEALRIAWAPLPEGLDFVMYWWHSAAELARSGKLRRFGLITTNKIRQEYSRKVVESHLTAEEPASILFAVADHPWVDSTDGAAIRVALTVGGGGRASGRLLQVRSETPMPDGEVLIDVDELNGAIDARLRVGANLGATQELQANRDVSSVGYQLTGKGFVLTLEEKEQLLAADTGSAQLIRPLVSGRDLTQRSRDLFAVDAFGLSSEQLMERAPAAYQWLYTRVKPERDQNAMAAARASWWIFTSPRPTLRRAVSGLASVLATSLTAKHRMFLVAPASNTFDSTTVVFALDDGPERGVLQSRVHLCWALAIGGRMGVGNDPRYTKAECFNRYPFPGWNSDELSSHVTAVFDKVCAVRTKALGAASELTITGLYNVLEKLRRAEPLTAKDKLVHDQGLVSVLRELHDDLDRAVFAAYGWEDLGERLVGKPGATTPWPEKPAEQAEAEEELLARLVALNAERAAEEARGIVRWLRPEFQNPQATGGVAAQTALPMAESEEEGEPGGGEKHRGARAAPTKSALRGRGAGAGAAARGGAGRGARAAPAEDAAAGDADATGDRLPWPKTAPEQARAVADVLAASRSPLSIDDIAARFTARGRWRDRLPQLLDTLAALGRARTEGGRWWAA